jgi:hypothetical protein
MSLETFKLQGNPFEGANIQTFKDATGAVFFIYSGTNPNDPTFKQQVARLKDGKYTWYSVPHPNHPRPTGTLEHDGLYVTYFSDEAGTVRRWKVTDFVMPATSGDGGTVMPPPPLGAVDEVARAGVIDNRTAITRTQTELNELKATVKRQERDILELRQQVYTLMNRPNNGLSWAQIRDHLWNDSIIQDKVYLDLQQKGGIYGMIEALVRSILGK